MSASDELDELALALGYGERPEGQGHVIRASGAELVALILRERRKASRDEDALARVCLLLEENGCNCECDHRPTSDDCDDDECGERCLACRIGAAIQGAA